MSYPAWQTFADWACESVCDLCIRSHSPEQEAPGAPEQRAAEAPAPHPGCPRVEVSAGLNGTRPPPPNAAAGAAADLAVRSSSGPSTPEGYLTRGRMEMSCTTPSLIR